jgi:hypothetical protein
MEANGTTRGAKHARLALKDVRGVIFRVNAPITVLMIARSAEKINALLAGPVFYLPLLVVSKDVQPRRIRMGISACSALWDAKTASPPIDARSARLAARFYRDEPHSSA